MILKNIITTASRLSHPAQVSYLATLSLVSTSTLVGKKVGTLKSRGEQRTCLTEEPLGLILIVNWLMETNL